MEAPSILVAIVVEISVGWYGCARVTDSDCGHDYDDDYIEDLASPGRTVALPPVYAQQRRNRMRLPVSLILSLGLLLFAGSVRAAETQEAKPIRVLLTFGGHGFQQPPFFEMFDKLPGITYEKAPLPASANRLKPGLEKEFDVLVCYDMVKAITPEQQKAYTDLLKTGIGLVALHHNLGAHRDWSEYAKIVGGKYLFKAEKLEDKDFPPSTYAHGQDLKIAVVDKEHPITKGLNDFEIHDEAYGGYFVTKEAHVLLQTDHPKCGKNIAWVKEYGKSRVLYLLLGHDSKAWKNPAYPALLTNGIRWAAQSATPKP